MLGISKTQWTALSQTRREDFIERARTRLSVVDPERFGRRDSSAQRSEIEAGIEAGRRLGIVSEHAVILLLETLCRFATHAQIRAQCGEWASNLFSSGECDPERTMGYLHEVVRGKVLEAEEPDHA